MVMTESAARRHCRSRDRGRCRVGGCFAKADHLHHIVYRSHSHERRWDTTNLLSLCPAHHALVHAGLLEISGDADRIVEITGDDFDLVALSCDGASA